MIACGVNLWVPGYGFWWMGQDGDAKFCEDARMMFFFPTKLDDILFLNERQIEGIEKVLFVWRSDSGVRGQLFIYICCFLKCSF